MTNKLVATEDQTEEKRLESAKIIGVRDNYSVEYLLKCFESQRQRSWFSKSTFDSLMRMRAIECNASSEYAEAFYARKVLLG